MSVVSDEIKVSTHGEVDIIDITDQVQECITKSKLTQGIVCLFVPGSTGGLTTVEYEPGLIQDLPHAFEQFAPKNAYYQHHETWHDDNGHSHVRASILGPSITLPFSEGKLIHGTWQQVVFVEFDTRARKRTIISQIIGE